MRTPAANLCPVCLARQEDHPTGWGRCERTRRLDLGGGAEGREGFLVVDLRADVAGLTRAADDPGFIADGWVEEVQALDLLEHFWRDDVDAVLDEWRRVLRPGGLLTVRVPNLLALSLQVAAAGDPGAHPDSVDDLLVDDTIRNIYGGHRWGPGGSWDTHHWGYTPVSLERRLERAGFAVLENDRRANMTVRAQR